MARVKHTVTATIYTFDDPDELVKYINENRGFEDNVDLEGALRVSEATCREVFPGVFSNAMFNLGYSPFEFAVDVAAKSEVEDDAG